MAKYTVQVCEITLVKSMTGWLNYLQGPWNSIQLINIYVQIWTVINLTVISWSPMVISSRLRTHRRLWDTCGIRHSHSICLSCSGSHGWDGEKMFLLAEVPVTNPQYLRLHGREISQINNKHDSHLWICVSLLIYRLGLGVWNFPAGFIFRLCQYSSAYLQVVDYCSTGRLAVSRIPLHWVVWTHFIWPFDDRRSLEISAPAQRLPFLREKWD